MGNLFRRKKRRIPLGELNLAEAFAKGINQTAEKNGYTGLCFTSACREIQQHVHGPQCRFTCICAKGQSCHDSGT